MVKRTIDKNEQKRMAGNLYNREVIVKYEIENFKDKAVTLDVSENIRAMRNEWRRHGPRRAMGAGPKEPLRRRAGQGKEHLRPGRLPRPDFPPAAPTPRPQKIVQKLHVVIKNEW